MLCWLSCFLALCLRSRTALAAENLFFRKQLVLFEEHKTRPRRATDDVRFVMSALGRFFEWRTALRVVQSDTFIRWHRKAFRLFWRWRSRQRGRPKLPPELRALIHRMAAENPIWVEARLPTNCGSTRASSLSLYGRQIPVERTRAEAQAGSKAALGDLRPESRNGNRIE